MRYYRKAYKTTERRVRCMIHNCVKLQYDRLPQAVRRIRLQALLSVLLLLVAVGPVANSGYTARG